MSDQTHYDRTMRQSVDTSVNIRKVRLRDLAAHNLRSYVSVDRNTPNHLQGILENAQSILTINGRTTTSTEPYA
jgi:hypothetical protein